MKSALLSRILAITAIAAVTLSAARADCYLDWNNIEWYFTVNADGGATIDSVNAPIAAWDPYSGGGYYNWDGTIPSAVKIGNSWEGMDEGPWYPVTVIGDSALNSLTYGADMLSSISVPDTVKRIGDCAFSGFSNVSSIDLPEDLEYLGWNVFDGCNNLSYDGDYYDFRVLDGWVLGPWQSWEGDYFSIESADMSTAKGIAAGAFSGCTTLRSAILPVTIGTLPHSAFYGCTDLTDIVVPASVTNIENGVFSSCSSLTNITFVGNAPTLQFDPNEPGDPEDNPFYGVSPQCVVTVQQGTTGWGNVPGTWNGLPTQYASAPATYTVTWRDSDGTLIDENSSWVYGAMPSHANPVKASDAQYNYYFSHWTPDLEPVVSNVTYTAAYDTSLRYYTITWLNDNGSRIRANQVGYGSTPTPPSATKAPTAFHTYTLSGWTPEIVPVTGTATYRAVYTAHPIYSGSGTEADPFVATSKADLVALVSATNNLCVKLAPGLSVDGPITVPATMTALSLDMNGGTIAGANGDPAIILLGNTAFSAKGTGTISADAGVEAVRRPGSVTAASGVTVTGLGGDGASGPATFAQGGKAVTAGIAPGANGTWALTAFAELAGGAAENLDDAQVKVYASDTLAGLATAEPMASGVTVHERTPAVKVEIDVAVPPGANAQFFRVGFE